MAKGINPKLKKKKRKLRSIDEYLSGIANGDRYVLSEVMTLVESTNTVQRNLGEQILNNLDLSNANHTIRIGITGSPGAGKSTFIESIGKHLIAMGKKIAVLAIDPSSTKSQGSILGDKTRMQILSVDENAIIRPTASANVLGGVARSTKESIALCEAAGYDYIFVESVGVGQSETDLARLVDVYLLLLLPGSGDEVQGIKRGVVELADIIVINKFDGDRKSIAEQSKSDFRISANLFNHSLERWEVPVLLSSSTTQYGIVDVWQSIEKYVALSKEQNHFYTNRTKQEKEWMRLQLEADIVTKAKKIFDLDARIKKMSNLHDFKTKSVFEALQEVKKSIDQEYQKLNDKK
ncbi:MAG: methylmalonyl Co-A mutase-associated GTPase MeaB [Saprospiraceae bacterium]